jgi:NADH:ubiquinone reductase (non-electrogenic)
LRKWYPEIADKLRITLIEALPNVLPAFSKRMIEYTESTFKTNKIDVMTRTAVKDVREKSVLVQDANKNTHEIPYGLLVWATGNTARELSRKLMGKLPEHQTNRRGILTDEHLRVLGAPEIYALGDAVAGQYAPTAQVASQQGTWLARTLAKTAQAEKLKEELNQLRATGADQADIERVVKKLNRAADVPSFTYSHQGSLA